MAAHLLFMSSFCRSHLLELPRRSTPLASTYRTKSWISKRKKLNWAALIKLRWSIIIIVIICVVWVRTLSVSASTATRFFNLQWSWYVRRRIVCKHKRHPIRSIFNSNTLNIHLCSVFFFRRFDSFWVMHAVTPVCCARRGEQKKRCQSKSISLGFSVRVLTPLRTILRTNI